MKGIKELRHLNEENRNMIVLLTDGQPTLEKPIPSKSRWISGMKRPKRPFQVASLELVLQPELDLNMLNLIQTNTNTEPLFWAPFRNFKLLSYSFMGNSQSLMLDLSLGHSFFIVYIYAKRIEAAHTYLPHAWISSQWSLWSGGHSSLHLVVSGTYVALSPHGGSETLKKKRKYC